MTNPIDYSRPVGWWCPVCGPSETPWVSSGTGRNCSRLRPHGFCLHPVIPVYLPLPTPEPVEVDEVETGEAEVVTWKNFFGVWYRGPSGDLALEETSSEQTPSADVINILVTGATE